jgi:hypothetical protein
MDLSVYAVDEKLAEEGIWRKLSIGHGRVKVAKKDNPAYRACVSRIILALPATADVNDEKVMDKILSQAMAETILVDWEDLADEGEELEYSHEAAFKMLDKYPEFREEVALISIERRNYNPEKFAGK